MYHYRAILTQFGTSILQYFELFSMALVAFDDQSLRFVPKFQISLTLTVIATSQTNCTHRQVRIEIIDYKGLRGTD